MKYYIEESDSRNIALKKLMKGCEFTKNLNECDVAVFAPNKKWNDNAINALPNGITVFAGKGDEIPFKKKKITYVNFLQNQNFAIKNANLTAEGVLTLILSETKKSVYNQKILILGLGRCGKAQVNLFSKMGLNVCAAAFREEDYANSALYVKNCYTSKNFKDHIGEFDVVINNNIFESKFDSAVIEKIKQDALFLEVASYLCMDAENAKHFKYVTAPGLPARFRPEAAAQLMKEVIEGVVGVLPNEAQSSSDSSVEAQVKQPSQISAQKNIGFGITGSFCTFASVIAEIEALMVKGYNVVPILSPAASSTDTRFGKAEDFKKKLKEITGNEIIDTMVGVEPLGPKGIIDALVIAPCTGNTLAKLANAVSDTPVTMAAKSLMRNFKPIVISISTNDALGFNLSNIAKLISAKNIYFVPFGQDDSKKKPKSLIANVKLIEETLLSAEKGEQIQPIFIK